MNVETYFAQPDSPSANSPVGKLLVRILAEYPESTFASAREKAHELLAVAAKARVYRLPAVRSAEAIAARKEQAAAYWKNRNAAQQAVAAVS